MKKLKVLIFGSRGLVGQACTSILSKSQKVRSVFASSREDTNLFDPYATIKIIEQERPNVIINAAAKVGGIVANNTQRVEFLTENLKINTNILEAVIPYPEIQIINLGSSCIYPLNAKNPLKEEYFMTGEREPTNSPYAMAKITAIELGRSLNKQYGHNVINLMPTNLYGPHDSFSEMDSHVIPGLIYRMNLSKSRNEDVFKIWGTGSPLREFLYSEDLADFIEFIIDKDLNYDLINVGSGVEISIKELAEKIKQIIKYEGQLSFDSTKPDGNPRKLLDNTIATEIGWKHKTGLNEGLNLSYNWFLNNIKM